MSDTYSYRNGEAEPPTVEGEYWFKGMRANKAHQWRVDVVQSSLHKRLMISGSHLGYYADFDEIDTFVGQWWGPIPEMIPPWDDNSDHDDLLAVRQESKHFIEEVAQMPNLGDVLDVGPMRPGGVFGKMPEMYVDARQLFGPNYRTMDCTGNADYIADISGGVAAPENVADTILLLNVLEHVPAVWRVPLVLWCMLRPNGRVMVLTPWRLRLHGPSPDCWRLTDEALRTLFAPPRWDIEMLEKRGGSALDPAVWVMIARAYAS